MKASDLSDLLALWRWVENPLEVAGARRRRRDVHARLRGGGQLALRAGSSDHHVFHRIFVRDEYRLGRDPKLGTVVDLGANVGCFSCRVARGSRRVIAYEPEPRSFARLEENTRGLANVVARRQAVGAEAGVATLHVGSSRYNSGRSTLHADIHAGAELLDRSVPVAVVPLDAVFAEHAIEHCDLLKIDVEGAEYEILYGASAATLARIARIAGEYHDVDPGDPRTRIEAFCDFLEQQGFSVETRPSRRHANSGLFFARRFRTAITDPPRPARPTAT